MDTNLENLIAMAAGQNRNCFDENSISSDARNKIDTALDSIFQGKSILIWARGEKLGVAWESAMDELRDEIFEIKNTAPIVEYLRIAVFSLRNRWKLKFMQSNERNSMANASDFELTDLRNYANSLIESGMQVIKDLIAAGTLVCAERGTQKNISMTMERTRSHEYERTRKR
ncbi:MAG: hypothetical protein J6Y07_01170 [Alphaproteobacteria bacterium]|nr:hypothetical protein [Alphaproteobacteria bacterium]